MIGIPVVDFRNLSESLILIQFTRLIEGSGQAPELTYSMTCFQIPLRPDFSIPELFVIGRTKLLLSQASAELNKLCRNRILFYDFFYLLSVERFFFQKRAGQAIEYMLVLFQ